MFEIVQNLRLKRSVQVYLLFGNLFRRRTNSKVETVISNFASRQIDGQETLGKANAIQDQIAETR